MAAHKVDKKREINGILYLTLALILGVAFYLPPGRSGWLGQILQTVGRGLFGVCALALPFLFIYMAFDYLLEKKTSLTRRRSTYVLILLIGTAALLHLLTTDHEAIRNYSLADENNHQAWQALKYLWQSGIDPSLIAKSGQTAFSGGLLGGGLALGLLAIAGPIGSLILIIAFILSFVILLFNLSLSRLLGRTARIIGETKEKVDQTVRDRVDQAKEKTEKIDKKSYDLLLQPETEENKQTQEPILHKPTLLEELKKIFLPDEYEDGLSDASIGPEPAALDMTAPYDIRVKTSDEAQNERQLPAGIHRVASDQKDLTEEKKSGGREHWIDRSEPVASSFDISKVSRTKAGEQIPLTFPYQPPPLRLLRQDDPRPERVSNQSIRAMSQKLEQTLESFGIQASVVNVTTGPTITRFELSPAPGVKVSRIVSLADDIALNLAALGVRIEAPIPGKSAIGIEIPNKETHPVMLRGLLESSEFQNTRSPLTAALGRDIQGNPILCDLTRMPHLLIAGATGSGKSVCINAILMSVLFRSPPEEVRMIMIDPKVVELSVYNGIPHLLAPVVTDPKKAANALNWAVNEMVRRYGLFAEKSVRDITSYRASAAAHTASVSSDNDEAEYEPLPLILLVIDELSDLMATAPTEVESAIARLTAMARAAGIHLIIATQRPSVDVITGVIKANIPSRIAFAVASQVDSRTILDMAGAEKLLGKGDLLYYPQSAAKPIRGQGAFITDSEVEQVLNYIKTHHGPDYDDSVSEAITTAQAETESEDKREDDELLPQALDVVVETGYASVSLLQRRLNVGYPRAARLIDTLHDKGYIGPFEGSKPRKLLITQAQYMEMKAKEKSEFH